MTQNVGDDDLERAAQWLRDADGLLVTAGAGMGVDSGLPDFRGAEGFWRAYPALRVEGVRFEDIANPAAFFHDPARAWGFYGHRLNLYRRTTPHRGFGILRAWSRRIAHDAFVFTSNVDGQFQQAGFADERIVECHGSIHWLQCVRSDCAAPWPASDVRLKVDETRCLLRSAFPRCARCGAIARPNILMFDDAEWIDARTVQQMKRFERWFSALRAPVVVELGAGRTVSTVRHFSERHGPRVIRINPRDEAIRARHGVGIAGGALDVLERLDARLGVA